MNSIKVHERETLSYKQQLANCRYALKMWKTIPDKNIYPGLKQWAIKKSTNPDCNTIACFGGWCVYMPKFKELGLYFDSHGYPTINLLCKFSKKPYTVWCNSLSYFLFGSISMFDSREDNLDKSVSDYEIVKLRLESQICELERILE
jgi:hypothetical protein